jgi:hypothetical protein
MTAGVQLQKEILAILKRLGAKTICLALYRQ